VNHRGINHGSFGITKCSTPETERQKYLRQKNQVKGIHDGFQSVDGHRPVFRDTIVFVVFLMVVRVMTWLVMFIHCTASNGRCRRSRRQVPACMSARRTGAQNCGEWRRRVPSRDRRFHQIAFGLAGELGRHRGRASERANGELAGISRRVTHPCRSYTVQSLGSFGSGFCGPGSSAPQSNLDCSLSVAGKDTTPAAFLLAGASDAKFQNTKVTLSVIPK
jgi:hypothetical protein